VFEKKRAIRARRRTRMRVWSLLLRLTANGTPVQETQLIAEARRNGIDQLTVKEDLREFEKSGDIEVVGTGFVPRGASTTNLDRNRAQALATMIQSQDSVTWLAFSLAVTSEAVLLAAFSQNPPFMAGLALAITGFTIALVFRSLVEGSNTDMSSLYNLADFDYPDTFRIPQSTRHARIWRISAQELMNGTLVAFMAGWVILYLLHFILDNPAGIKPFL
jgi:hypothetical protein